MLKQAMSKRVIATQHIIWFSKQIACLLLRRCSMHGISVACRSWQFVTLLGTRSSFNITDWSTSNNTCKIGTLATQVDNYNVGIARLSHSDAPVTANRNGAAWKAVVSYDPGTLAREYRQLCKKNRLKKKVILLLGRKQKLGISTESTKESMRGESIHYNSSVAVSSFFVGNVKFLQLEKFVP